MKFCSESVQYINYFFTKKAPRITKKAWWHFSVCVIWNSQWGEMYHQCVSKDAVWQEIGQLYWCTTVWNETNERQNFYLAINQMSLTSSLKVFWTCSVYRLHLLCVITCEKEAMCLRPSPVYIKMWRKHEQKPVICGFVHSFACARRKKAAVSGPYMTRVTRMGW